MSKQVLILNITRIGDLVQTVPLISRLHREWADVAVDLVVDVRCAPMAALLPGVRSIFSEDFETRFHQGEAGTRDAVAVRREMLAWAKPLQEARYDRVVNLTFTPASGALTAALGVPDTRGLMTRRTGAAILCDPWLTHVVDLHQHRRLNRFNLVDLYALGGSGPGPYMPMRLAIATHAQEWASRYLHATLQGRSPIAIQIGASDPIKAWRPDYFGRTMAAIHRRVDAPFLLTGTMSEAVWAKQAVAAYRASGGAGIVHDALGSTDLPELAALLARCRLLLTNDTGPMHVAVAAGTPVIDLSLASFYFRETGPYGPGHWVIQPDLPCAPCPHDRPCAQHACKDMIVPDQVSALLLSVLEGHPFPSAWSGVQVYESRIDEDGLVDYAWRAGRKDGVVDWYGTFWRRCRYETYTGQLSRIPPNAPPPDLVHQQRLFRELVPILEALYAGARHLAEISGVRPFPFRTFKAVQRDLVEDRRRLIALALPSAAFGPIAVALIRELHNCEGLALHSMTEGHARAYRNMRDFARAVIEQLESRTVTAKPTCRLATAEHQ